MHAPQFFFGGALAGSLVPVRALGLLLYACSLPRSGVDRVWLWEMLDAKAPEKGWKPR